MAAVLRPRAIRQRLAPTRRPPGFLRALGGRADGAQQAVGGTGCGAAGRACQERERMANSSRPLPTVNHLVNSRVAVEWALLGDTVGVAGGTGLGTAQGGRPILSECFPINFLDCWECVKWFPFRRRGGRRRRNAGLRPTSSRRGRVNAVVRKIFPCAVSPVRPSSARPARRKPQASLVRIPSPPGRRIGDGSFRTFRSPGSGGQNDGLCAEDSQMQDSSPIRGEGRPGTSTPSGGYRPA